MRKNVRGQRNAFDDLDFSAEEAAALGMKAALHSKIVFCAKNHSQTQLQKMLGEPQPGISDLLRGKISKSSLETLVNYAEALHLRPEIKTHAPGPMRATRV
jgi:predicted XRE-type DNA-binding protein